MKKPKHLTCRCGGKKKGWDLMCRNCWSEVPLHLRRALSRPGASVEDRRAAVRAINEYRARGAVPAPAARRPRTTTPDPRCPGIGTDRGKAEMLKTETLKSLI